MNIIVVQKEVQGLQMTAKTYKELKNEYGYLSVVI